jgi:flagellar FliL protein
MSDGAPAAAVGRGAASGPSRRGWRIILLAAIVLIVAGSGGAGYYYYLSLGRAASEGAHAAQTEPRLPFYLEIKPLVVSMQGGDDGETHLVQLGVDLTLSGAPAGSLVTALLPEIADALRLSVLSVKLSDITTPSGVDKLRARMTTDLNRMLRQRLGADRIAEVSGGRRDLVQNIYFSQLIIQ